MDLPASIEGLQAALEGFGTNEARMVASAVVVISAVLVGRVLIPVLVQLGKRTLARRLVRGPVESVLETIRRHVPWTIPAIAFIRGLQGFVIVLTSLALLVIWGRLDLAAWVVSLMGGAAPNFAKLLLSLSLVGGAFVATSLLEDQIRRFSSRTDRLTRHQEEIVYRVLQLSTFGVAGLMILGLWEIDLSGLLIGAGFLGIVFGMAARRTLGSLIAGFVLMFARPFEIGDWVQIGDHEGIVTDISLSNTRLENFDGEFVVVSNDRVGDDVVVNRTRKGRLRVRLEVGVDYATDLEQAESLALEATRDVDEVMTVPAPQVIPKRFGDSAIVLEVRFWVDKPSSRRRWRATAEVIRAIKATYDAEGIKIPYPQRELSGREETGGFRIVDGVERSERTPPGA